MGFSTLEIGKKALLAQRYGIEVTSNNIANANTEGYSRKRVEMKQSDSQYKNGNFYGTGVIADELRGFREEFFDKEVRNSVSRMSAFEADEEILNKIEGILGEPSESGLGNLISDFFISWDELAANPDKTAYRQNVISSAQKMTDKFHQLADGTEELRTDVLGQLKNKVDNVNKLAERVRDLNAKINSGSSSAAQNDLSMVDEREKLLEELSQYGKIGVQQNDDGTVNVNMNGINLVTGRSFNELKLVETTNSSTGERTIGIYQTDNSGNLINKIDPGSGELDSLITHYNETLDKDDTSGNFSFAKDINELAKEIAANINAISENGYGLNDTGATPPGRAFFIPALTDADAFTINVNPDILNNPSNIPTSSAAGVSGNNDIASQIANLADDLNFINNKTPDEFYNELLSSAGNMLNDAKTGKKNSTMVTDQLKNQRESIIGVNLDEEAINLIKYQRSFEAASRVINITDEVLGTIVNLGR